MSYTIKDVSGQPLAIDSNTSPGNLVLPKFSLSDSAGTNITASNPLWTQIPDCPVTAPVSINAAGVLFSIDTTTFQSIAIQVTVPGTSNTISFEGSNNNTDWFAVTGFMSNNIGTVQPLTSIASPAAGSIYLFPVYAQYFRARVSTFTTGPVTVVYRQRDTQMSVLGTYIGGGSVAVNNVPSVYPRPVASGGLTQFRVSTPTANSANLLAVKITAGQVYGYHFYNVATSPRYVHFYNALTTGVTIGTTGDARVVAIPPASSVSYSSGDLGIPFSTAVSIAITTGAAPSDGTIANIAVNDVIGMIDYA